MRQCAAQNDRSMLRAVTDRVTRGHGNSSVSECNRVLQSAAECGRVRQTAAEHSKGCYRSRTRPRAVETCEELLQIRSGARQLECGRVRQSAAECGRVRQSATECDGVRKSAAQCREACEICYISGARQTAITIKSQVHMGEQQQFEMCACTTYTGVFGLL